MDKFNWISEQWPIIVTALFFLSELIGELSHLKSNSVYGLIRNFLKGEYKKAKPTIEERIDKSESK